MVNDEALQDKVENLYSLLDPVNLPEFLSDFECSQLSLLNSKIRVVLNEFERTEQKGVHIKVAMEALDEIEMDANKIIYRRGEKLKYIGIVIALVVWYVLGAGAFK